MSGTPTDDFSQDNLKPEKSVAEEFGLVLRRAREHRRLTLEDAARACMLSDSQIIGLEAANFAAFYSVAYAQRATERYANYLGIESIPEEFVVHNCKAASGHALVYGADSPSRDSRHRAWLVVMIIIVCGLISRIRWS